MARLKRLCQGTNEQGGACQQPPLVDRAYCFWHDPEHAEEAREARRLGGLRRRREHALSGAYDFEGLETVGDIRRLLYVAAVDSLALENSVARSRTLVAVAVAALKALETGELEQRLAALEAAVHSREAPPVFDVEVE